MNSATSLSTDPRRLAIDIADCYDQLIRAELTLLAPNEVVELDRKRDQIRQAIAEAKEDVEICFLGKAGVGKSTLINALVAGTKSVLPSGGVGTLTAQATSLSYSNKPCFEARYRGADFIHQLVFGLEKRLEAHKRQAERAAAAATTGEDNLSFLDDLPDEGADTVDSADDLERQARLLITGRQDATTPLPYLIDGLLAAQKKPLKHGSTFQGMDDLCIRNIALRLEYAKDKQSYKPTASEDTTLHLEDLLNHAAGHLSPMVTELRVGWPSDSIKPGMTMVDLPGLGIAKDIYRKVTEHHIREVAKAVVLVVDRSGIDEDSADLLDKSGFFNRLIAASNDLQEAQVLLVIVAVGMDKSAASAYEDAVDKGTSGGRKPEHYLESVRTAMSEKLRRDLASHLQVIAGRLSSAGGVAGREVVDYLVKNALICAVSTVEYTRLLRKDPALPAHISHPDQSGIPALNQQMIEVMETYRKRLVSRASSAALDLSRRLGTLLDSLKTKSQPTAASAPLKDLETAYDLFVRDLSRQLDARRGSFRAYLTNGLDTKIELIIEKAGRSATLDIRKEMKTYATAHWKSLQAAVSGGGRHSGATSFDLPMTFSNPFEAQVMSLLVQEVVPEIQNQAAALAADYATCMRDIEEWLARQPDAASRTPVMRQMVRQYDENAIAMREIGLEGAETIRKAIAKELYKVMRDPIAAECRAFIRAGRNSGKGIKDRIRQLFDDLIPLVIRQSSGPTKKLILETTSTVTARIRDCFARYQEPIESARSALFAAQATGKQADDGRAAQLARIDALKKRLSVMSPGKAA